MAEPENTERYELLRAKLDFLAHPSRVAAQALLEPYRQNPNGGLIYYITECASGNLSPEELCIGLKTEVIRDLDSAIYGRVGGQSVSGVELLHLVRGLRGDPESSC